MTYCIAHLGVTGVGEQRAIQLPYPPAPYSPPPNLPVLPLPLQGRRPLVPLDMPMSEEVGEVLATFRAASRLGRTSLGAYVISMTKRASDVLAVELLQREAAMQV